MARIRSIHPDACDSDKLSRLSDSAERTFWRLLTHADDYGRGEDRPKLLAAKLYPVHDDKDADTVDRDLNELAKVGLLQRYEVDGQRFFAIPTFTDWQKPRHPTDSKFPSPEDGRTVTADRDIPTADSGNDTVTADRRKPPAGVEWSGVEVGGGGAGSELEPEDEPPTDVGANGSKRSKPKTAPPASFKVTPSLRAWVDKNGLGYLDLEEQTERMLDWHRSHGQKHSDWNATWRNWMRRAPEFSPEPAAAGHLADTPGWVER